MAENTPNRWYPREKFVGLVVLLVCGWLSVPSFAQLTNCGHCVCDQPGITCDFDKLRSRIKDNIDLAEIAPSGGVLRSLEQNPLSYRELYINCKNSPSLRRQRLTRELFHEFANLTRLVIVKCDLVAIEPDALSGLEQLTELDVSYNSLARLPPGLFNTGSRSTLRSLILSDNPGLLLDPDVFKGLTLDKLVLSNCKISEFPWASLKALSGLQQLTLSQNDIKFVPEPAIDFTVRLKVFYLDDNPLSCTCANKWLREKISWERVSPPIFKSSKQPKCGSPQNLRDFDLPKLSPSDFLCQSPEIVSVDVQLQADSAQLICSAAASRQTSSPLVWTYRHQTIFPDIPNGYPSRSYSGSGATFRQSVRRTPGYERERYMVTASGENGQTANFSLTIHWPEVAGTGSSSQSGQQKPQSPTKRPSKSPASSDSATLDKKESTVGDGEDSSTSPKDPQQTNGAGVGGIGGNYFSRKQFTLVEMIIAVVGTFMGTSLIFLLSCQFTRWYNKRDKKRWAAGYASQPYGYNYNSHRPASHEYDVPRIDMPCLPKQPQPPLPPPVPLPMPQTLPQTPVTSTPAVGIGAQTLAASHHHPHHHHQKQQQQLLPKPPTPPSPTSCDEISADLEFLDYNNGQRWMLSAGNRLN